METSTVTTRVEKPNSYEVGKAGARFKLYFNEIQELLDMLKILKQENLVIQETVT